MRTSTFQNIFTIFCTVFAFPIALVLIAMMITKGQEEVDRWVWEKMRINLGQSGFPIQYESSLIALFLFLFFPLLFLSVVFALLNRYALDEIKIAR